MGSQEKSEKNKAQRSKNGKELVEGLGKRSTQLKKWGSKRTRMWRAAEGAGKGTPQRVWVLLEGHWKAIGGLIMMKVSSRDRGHITFGVTRGFVPWDPGWEMSWANAGMESPEEGTVCCSSLSVALLTVPFGASWFYLSPRTTVSTVSKVMRSLPHDWENHRMCPQRSNALTRMRLQWLYNSHSICIVYLATHSTPSLGF